MNKRRLFHGLRVKSLLVLLIAAVAAVLVYELSLPVLSFAIDHYIDNSDYLLSHNEKLAEEFAAYVSENQLSTSDGDEIESWIDGRKNVYITMMVMQGDSVVYDSGYAYDFLYDDIADEDDIHFHSIMGTANKEVTFADGDAELYLYGYFDYSLYNLTYIIAMGLSVAVFILVFMLFLRRMIRYILKLEKEIKILETGGLDHEITVKGKDELGELADGMNHMRIALKDNMEKREEAVDANYSLVVSVAHDLRTPLTALLLYLDLMKKDSLTGEEKTAYLEKSRTKAAQIKVMTDDLFERFLLSRSKQPDLETPESARMVFEDSLSALVSSLYDRGFEADCRIGWPDCMVQVVTAYVSRILDNILSNIFKYADPAEPIVLKAEGTDGGIRISVRNRILRTDAGTESSHVGVSNIRMMMERMHGSCSVTSADGYYEISLLFPVL